MNKKLKILLSFISGFFSLVPAFSLASGLKGIDPGYVSPDYFGLEFKKVLGDDAISVLLKFLNDVIKPCFEYFTNLISDFLDFIIEYPLLFISISLVFLISVLGFILKCAKRV